MTKEEIRAVSLSKLGLARDSICYDIGAGTGSVAVEMALRAVLGEVYAIEKNEKALALICANQKRFALDNLKLVPGKAPEALKDLPAPTHVFIGGSSGYLEEILDTVYQKNPAAILLVNCITLETLSKAVSWIKAHDAKAEIVSVQVSRSTKAGRYHLMKGENPVYIIRLQIEGAELLGEEPL